MALGRQPSVLWILGCCWLPHAGRAAETEVQLGKLVSGYVKEDGFACYAVRIPRIAPALKVIITPIFGDPDVYISFLVPEPDDTTATWVMDDMGTEERLLRRKAADFCPSEPCVLHLAVYGYEAAEFRLAVYETEDIDGKGSPNCAPDCPSFGLSDGRCDLKCNTSACFYDGGDCLVERSKGTCDWKTRAGCPSSWIGDGVCDEACFVEECDWDGNDCSTTKTEEICHPGCMAAWINDGECDVECNNEACEFDGECLAPGPAAPGTRLCSHPTAHAQAQTAPTGRARATTPRTAPTIAGGRSGPSPVSSA